MLERRSGTSPSLDSSSGRRDYPPSNATLWRGVWKSREQTFQIDVDDGLLIRLLIDEVALIDKISNVPRQVPPFSYTAEWQDQRSRAKSIRALSSTFNLQRRPRRRGLLFITPITHHLVQVSPRSRTVCAKPRRFYPCTAAVKCAHKALPTLLFVPGIYVFLQCVDIVAYLGATIFNNSNQRLFGLGKWK